MRWIYYPALQYLLNGGISPQMLCTDQPLVLTTPTTTAPNVQWVQISGDPITLTNANTIHPTVTLPQGYNSLLPLILRVSVVGMPTLFRDVEIQTNLNERARNLGAYTDTLGETQACFASAQVIGYTPQPLPPVTDQQVYLMGDPGNYYVGFSLPACFQEYVIGYRLQQLVNGSYQNVAVFFYDSALTAYSPQSLSNILRFDNFKYLVNVGETYRVLAIGLYAEQQFEGPGPPFTITPALGTGIGVVANDSFIGGNYGTTGSVTLSLANLTFNILLSSLNSEEAFESPGYTPVSSVSLMMANLLFFTLLTSLGTSEDLAEPFNTGAYSSSVSSLSISPLLWNTNGIIL